MQAGLFCPRFSALLLSCLKIQPPHNKEKPYITN
jgi:hypothetical protein